MEDLHEHQQIDPTIAQFAMTFTKKTIIIEVAKAHVKKDQAFSANWYIQKAAECLQKGSTD